MIDDNSTNLDASGVWMTVTELAEAKGIGRSAVSERVLRLEEQGLLTTRPGKGRTKLINLAEYDRIVGQVTDLARKQGAATRRGGESESEGAGAAYTREQARNMAYRAEMSRLELEERLGNLVEVAKLRPIITASATAAVAVIERLPQEADELRAICARDEGAGLERALKAIAHRMRADIAIAIEAAMPAASAG